MQWGKGGGGAGRVEGVTVGLYPFPSHRCTSDYHKLHMYTA